MHLLKNLKKLSRKTKKREINKMKQFYINYNDLYKFSEKPKIYLPFTKDLIFQSERVLAIVSYVDKEYKSERKDFNFKKFLNNLPSARNKKKYAKELKEFEASTIAHKKEWDSKPQFQFDYSFSTYVKEHYLWDDYFYHYLDSLKINYVEIEISQSGMGGCGGSIDDITLFYVEDVDKKISNLLEEEFSKLIIDRCNK